MDSGTLIALVIGSLTVLIGGFGLYKQITATTAADRDRAAQRVDAQLAAARAEERARCADRVDQLGSQLAEMTSDRNSERARADGLQRLINELRLGGNP